jgi:hypothetical protein
VTIVSCSCADVSLHFGALLNPLKCVFTWVNIRLQVFPKPPIALRLLRARDSSATEVNAIRLISAGAGTPVAPRRILVAHWPAGAALIAVPWQE